MDIVLAHVLLELAHRFEEGQPLDVAHRPPISTMTTSTPWATLRMAALIWSVMWGMTWTVRPR